jgi:chaperonin GroEL
MAKDINFTPRSKLKKGLDIVADAVKITIGPKGRNVAIEQGGTPIIANDAGTVAKYITLKDPLENMGAQIIKDVIQKTSEKVGGGRTASAILTQAIVDEGIKVLDKGMNISLLKKGMQEAVKDISQGLKDISKPVSTPDEIKQIATISTESEELGELIADVINKVGKDCNVTYEDSQVIGVTTTVEDGIKFDKGWISPYMVTNRDRMEAEHKDIPVLIMDKKVSSYTEVYPVLQALGANGKNSLMIICEDMDGAVLDNFAIMQMGGAFKLLAVKIPGFSDKKEWLDDIALITGATAIGSINKIPPAVRVEKGQPLPQIEYPTYLGMAKKVTSTKDSTLILGTVDTAEKTKELTALKENTKVKYEQDKLTGRIGILSGKVAVIRIGSATESELKYLKLKIEDGVNESKRALEEGIVPGGDSAFINALKSQYGKTKELPTDTEAIGYKIVVQAVNAPFQQIIKNADDKAEVILAMVEQNKNTSAGYDALSGKVVDDMFACGIIDAVKVTRTVLENAVSAAGMFLTIEATITEENTEDVKQTIEY